MQRPDSHLHELASPGRFPLRPRSQSRLQSADSPPFATPTSLPFSTKVTVRYSPFGIDTISGLAWIASGLASDFALYRKVKASPSALSPSTSNLQIALSRRMT